MSVSKRYDFKHWPRKRELASNRKGNNTKVRESTVNINVSGKISLPMGTHIQKGGIHTGFKCFPTVVLLKWVLQILLLFFHLQKSSLKNTQPPLQNV